MYYKLQFYIYLQNSLLCVKYTHICVFRGRHLYMSKMLCLHLWQFHFNIIVWHPTWLRQKSYFSPKTNSSFILHHLMILTYSLSLFLCFWEFKKMFIWTKLMTYAREQHLKCSRCFLILQGTQAQNQIRFFIPFFLLSSIFSTPQILTSCEFFCKFLYSSP